MCVPLSLRLFYVCVPQRDTRMCTSLRLFAYALRLSAYAIEASMHTYVVRTCASLHTYVFRSAYAIYRGEHAYICRAYLCLSALHTYVCV